MSTISVQCDRLREMAKWLENNGFFASAKEIHNAADTIWKLRNDLAEMVDERERVRLLSVENERLKEVVQALLTCCCKVCEHQTSCLIWQCTTATSNSHCQFFKPSKHLQTLGIEV